MDHVRNLMLTAGVLLLLAVALGYLGDVAFILDVAGYFRVHLMILAGVVTVAGLAIGAWRAAGAAAAAVLLALAGVPALWAEAPGAEGSEGVFTLLTANLLYENSDMPALRAALNAADADILVTNETTVEMLEGADSLALRYPYRVTVRTDGRILRTVLWSKFPVSETSLLLNDEVEPNAAIARVRLPDGSEVTIVGVHLDQAIGGEQERQIAAFERVTYALERPLVVAGDFNAAPWSVALSRVEKSTGTRLIPGYRLSWHGPYPSPLGPIPEPLGHAIDHVLLSPDLEATAVRVIELPGSDHDGILATIRTRGI